MKHDDCHMKEDHGDYGGEMMWNVRTGWNRGIGVRNDDGEETGRSRGELSTGLNDMIYIFICFLIKNIENRNL